MHTDAEHLLVILKYSVHSALVNFAEILNDCRASMTADWG